MRSWKGAMEAQARVDVGLHDAEVDA